MAIVRFCVAFFNHNIARSGSVASVGSLARISHTVAGGARGAIAHPVNITDQGIPAMARETIYLVQAFKPGRGTRLNADPAIRCKSAEGALRTAEGLAPTRAGSRSWVSTTMSRRSFSRLGACRRRSETYEGMRRRPWPLSARIRRQVTRVWLSTRYFRPGFPGANLVRRRWQVHIQWTRRSEPWSTAILAGCLSWRTARQIGLPARRSSLGREAAGGGWVGTEFR